MSIKNLKGKYSSIIITIVVYYCYQFEKILYIISEHQLIRNKSCGTLYYHNYCIFYYIPTVRDKNRDLYEDRYNITIYYIKR